LDQLVSITIEFFNCICIVFLIDSLLYFLIGLDLKLPVLQIVQELLIFDCNKIYIVNLSILL